MRKIQFFIFIEAILLSMALMTILANDFSRVVLLLVLFLLLFYYYRGHQRANVLLVSASILLFFIIMLNPYVIAAVLFAVVYGLIVVFPYIYRENEDSHLIFEEETVMKEERNRWLGDLHHLSAQDHCQFDDINLFRLAGRDTIHLEEVILTNHDNVVLLRKGFGDTRIIVPVDVAVSLQANSLYGQLIFLEQPARDLRNETISIKTADFQKASKSVKIVLSNLVGNIEVVRR
ncbi:cell wall-active antibiotics response protein LiaF [Streptococcus oricebi]|uniref:Transporter n=1 Tax=Streptococcus oricebi TaxID=1547447 RepID=A0ABS5B3M1_9STRE|nr:cell wall-active antibiotics response protein LiaF [Streptococcus oricebi]MBP2623438.1 transporter [Streptococcus oricebi]